jgi:hypothetical protein
MIDITKKYKTRDGQEITQLVKFDNIESDYLILGVVDGEIFRWTENGKHRWSCNEPHIYDMIEVKEPVEINIWVGISFSDIHKQSPRFSDDYFLARGYELRKFREVIED